MNQHNVKSEPSSFDTGFEDFPTAEIPKNAPNIEASTPTNNTHPLTPFPNKFTIHEKDKIQNTILKISTTSENLHSSKKTYFNKDGPMNMSFENALWQSYDVPKKKIFKTKKIEPKVEESEMEENGPSSSSMNSQKEITTTTLINIESGIGRENKEDAKAHTSPIIRHSVWKFFKAYNQLNEEGLFQKAACGFCGVVLSNVKAINAMDHLNKTHPGEYIKVSDMEKDRLKNWVKLQKSKSSKEKNFQVEISEKLVCDKCAYTTTDSAELTRHKLVHTGQTYSCNVDGCSFVATQKAVYLRHIRQHAEPAYKCSTCKAGFSTQKELIEHTESHYLKCTEKYCIFKTKNPEYMEKHMLEFHKKDAKKKDVRKDQKPGVAYKNFTSPFERKACAERAMEKATDVTVKKSLGILVTTGVIPKTKEKFENYLRNAQNMKNEELIQKVWKAFIAEAEIAAKPIHHHSRDLDNPKKRRFDLDAPPKDMESRAEGFVIPKRKSVDGPVKKKVRFSDDIKIIPLPPDDDGEHIFDNPSTSSESIPTKEPLMTHTQQDTLLNQNTIAEPGTSQNTKPAPGTSQNTIADAQPKIHSPNQPLFSSQIILKKKKKKGAFSMSTDETPKSINEQWQLFIQRAMKNPKLDQNIRNMLRTLVGVHNLPKTEEKFVKFMTNSRNFKDEAVSREVFKEIIKGAEKMKQDMIKAGKPKKPKKIKEVQLGVEKPKRGRTKKMSVISDHIQMAMDSVMANVLKGGQIDNAVSENEQNIVGVTAVVMESQASSSNELLANLLQDVIKNKEMKKELETEENASGIININIKTEIQEIEISNAETSAENPSQPTIPISATSTTPLLSSMLQNSQNTMGSPTDGISTTQQLSYRHSHPMLSPVLGQVPHPQNGGPLSPQQMGMIPMQVLADGRAVPVHPINQMLAQRAAMMHQQIMQHHMLQIGASRMEVPGQSGVGVSGSMPQRVSMGMPQITQRPIYPMMQPGNIVSPNQLGNFVPQDHTRIPTPQTSMHRQTPIRPVAYPCSNHPGCPCQKCTEVQKNLQASLGCGQMTSPIWYPQQEIQREFVYPNIGYPNQRPYFGQSMVYPSQAGPMGQHLMPMPQMIIPQIAQNSPGIQMAQSPRFPYPQPTMQLASPLGQNMQILSPLGPNAQLLSPGVAYPTSENKEIPGPENSKTTETSQNSITSSENCGDNQKNIDGTSQNSQHQENLHIEECVEEKVSAFDPGQDKD